MPTQKRPIQRANSRLKSVAYGDKIAAIENMLKVLKSEEYRLLTDFMYLSDEDLQVYVDLTDRGEYLFTIRAVTDRLIDVGRLL